jgi:hypothetical protein
MTRPMCIALIAAIVAAIVVPILGTQCGSAFDNICGSSVTSIALYLSGPALVLSSLFLRDDQIVASLVPILVIGTFVWVFTLVYAAIRLIGHFRRVH